jgi:hypothetical protein
MIPGHVSSQWSELPWTTQSPDLGVCDYFLLDYFKVKAINRPCTVNELKVVGEDSIMEIIPPPIYGTTLNEQLLDEAAKLNTKRC